MPNRIIREAILSSEKMALLGWPEEVFYRRLMSIVDDYGRHEANPQLLRARCYPLQTDAVRAADISRWMAACQKAGLILCYEVSGKCYLEVVNFQQQRRTDSKWPPPPSKDGPCERLLSNASKCEETIGNAHLGVCGVEGVVVDEGVVECVTRTRAGEACIAMKEAGLGAVNPSHPKLISLLDAGMTIEELRDAASIAAKAGKPFAYALATAEGRRRDAATTPLPAKRQRQSAEPEWRREQRERTAQAVPSIAAKPLQKPFEIIEMEEINVVTNAMD